MPAKKPQSPNFSLPQPSNKIAIHSPNDTDDAKKKAKTASGLKHVAFEEKPKEEPNQERKFKRAAEIGDISRLGLGFDGRNYDCSGMMELITNNVLVTQNTLVSQEPLPSAPQPLRKCDLHIIILPNEAIGMATSDAKYYALVVKENSVSIEEAMDAEAKIGAGGEGMRMRATPAFTELLHGHACPTFGQALQSLLWKSVVGAVAYAAVPGWGLNLKGGSEEDDE